MKLNKLNVSIGLSITIIVVMIAIGKSHPDEAEIDAHGLKVIIPSKYVQLKNATDITCLDGVEYWVRYHGYGASVSPKFSSGNAIPDVCVAP